MTDVCVEVKTHKELEKAHGKAFSAVYKYKYKLVPFHGKISVRTLQSGNSYVYLCNDIYGKSVTKLKVEENFGYNKAMMISYSRGQSKYENKWNSRVTNINVVSNKRREVMFKESIKKNTAIYIKNRTQLEKLIHWCDGRLWNEYNISKAVGYYYCPYEDKYGLPDHWTKKGMKLISYEEALKEKPMNKKEKALKELEEIRKRTNELEKIIYEPEIEYYEVETPISTLGNIIFNNNRQLLSCIDELYRVDYNTDGIEEAGKQFVWVPCRRSELKVGDTAYGTNYKDKVFEDELSACKILSSTEYVYVDGTNIYVKDSHWTYWYKLVRRDELGV